MGGDGSIFALRRELYPNFPDSVLDDLVVSMAAVFAGKRLIKADDVIAYERIVADKRDEIFRKVRIATRAYHTHVFLHSQLLKMTSKNKFKYISHKFLRWFGGGFLFTGILSLVIALSMLSTWLVLVFILLGSVSILFGYIASQGKLASFVEVIIALLATQWGVFSAMREKYSKLGNLRRHAKQSKLENLYEHCIRRLRLRV